ncbi:MAG TPA: formylmethanofuran dehydrogenase subunit A, partial [Solirubrobacteraceae bacterium]|nr:formylmethanofuran dehydrogenase subunit A [Solirubrobacteraceae bacterium]
LAPEEHRGDVVERSAVMRSGTGGTVPSTFVTGYRYALLGYTTVVEAATPPLAARHVLAELRDTPMIDALFLVLMGNNVALFDLIRRDPARVRDAIAWWLEATGGYGIKLVNPGGIERWKRGEGNVTSLDDEVAGLTPRQVIEAIASAAHELGLPHPVHVHCNNLGVAGNWRTTLDTLRTMEGRRAHLAHLQFHAYGGRPGGRMRSRAPDLAEYLGAHPEFSADVGQVMFGPATTMTADAPVSERLRDITGGKWVNADTEVETGCGIVPFTYREKNYVHALQWGIGLELFLLSRDPWRLVLSTDHPNGGSFLSYPKLIRLLMDRDYRNDQLKRANRKAIQRTVLLDDLDREYTLEEIAIVTRAGPARLLGLRDKGHLGAGADADVTIYDERDDREEMFATPRYVIKGGRVVVRDGELVEAVTGDLLRVGAAHDPAIEEVLRDRFQERYTVQFDNYPVREPWLLEPARRVPAGRPA